MPRFLAPLLLTISFSAGAIVIRSDVDDSKYRVPATEFPELVDMPGEGHGVLIAPQWVVTAAHAVTWQAEIKAVVINGAPREVERLIVHPGYKKLPQNLIDDALASGDATKVIAFLASSDDIALLKLTRPVKDVVPAAVYKGSDEQGKIIKIIGKGATGTGEKGQDPHGSHRTELRRAFNRITVAQGHWLSYAFHKPETALPLEGITGDGDSGGPVLIETGDRWQVAGLASWKRGEGNAVLLRSGFYGQINYSTRLSAYADWIDDVTRIDAKSPRVEGAGASQILK